MHLKKQQLEPDMEHNRPVSNWKRSMSRWYIVTLLYLTFTQSTSCEIPGCMKHTLESTLLGEILITSDMQMTPPLWQKVKRNWKASWWKRKRRMKKLQVKSCGTYTQWNITQLLFKKCIWIHSNEVDETGGFYTEWSKSERKAPIQYINAYIWNLERW